jgi:hypothetical protein
MAPIQGPATPMQLYRLYWISGGTAGEVMDHAPDAATLEATVRARPSLYGIPHEDAIIGPARLVPYDETRRLEDVA